MSRENFAQKLLNIFEDPPKLDKNYIHSSSQSTYNKQQQTNDAFSEKWAKYNTSVEKETFYSFQKEWYLNLYGFSSEKELQQYLSTCKLIIDAGCGLGYKAAWFAKLSPSTIVLGIDFSDAAQQAATNYVAIPNLYFMQGNISNTGIKDGAVDFLSCDQVIMHTEDPFKTFSEFARIIKKHRGQIACYFYAKKALPRELLDDYFRSACLNLSQDELWSLSEQLMELGKRLSELKIKFICPEIPLLGIKGGEYDIQRFIYWNFLKCFWNKDLGPDTSLVTNYDWYSPSNAYRFSEDDIHKLIAENKLIEIFFHAEEACYSGRFAFKIIS